MLTLFKRKNLTIWFWIARSDISVSKKRSGSFGTKMAVHFRSWDPFFHLVHKFSYYRHVFLRFPIASLYIISNMLKDYSLLRALSLSWNVSAFQGHVRYSHGSFHRLREFLHMSWIYRDKVSFLFKCIKTHIIAMFWTRVLIHPDLRFVCFRSTTTSASRYCGCDFSTSPLFLMKDIVMTCDSIPSRIYMPHGEAHDRWSEKNISNRLYNNF